MMNLIKVWANPNSRGVDEQADILSHRAQFTFWNLYHRVRSARY